MVQIKGVYLRMKILILSASFERSGVKNCGERYQGEPAVAKRRAEGVLSPDYRTEQFSRPFSNEPVLVLLLPKVQEKKNI